MLVVGLGNPGDRYRLTRHNVGFMVLDLLDTVVDAVRKVEKTPWGILKRLQWGEVLCTTLRPLTYMNRSGIAVVQAMRREGLTPSSLLVIHDDLDLPVGRLKIARRGGSGGHRGVESIAVALATKEFLRMKIGIGRPLYGESVMDYVLAPPYRDEEETLHRVLTHAVEAVKVLCESGAEKAMNLYNGLMLAGEVLEGSNEARE